MHKVLVVDDDVALTDTIYKVLKQEQQFIPLIAHTAEDGLKIALSADVELALLDIMIPIMGGLELCQHIRARSNMPIIFLTAMGDVESVVAGLGMGADDYLVKPYDPKALVARVNAHLRRYERAKAASPTVLNFCNGEFIIDLPARRVQVNAKEVELTPREFDLLSVLVQNPGRVITTSELIQMAWGSKFRDATENLKPYIHYLRRKVEKDPAQPRWIVTARGVGYRFMDE